MPHIKICPACLRIEEPLPNGVIHVCPPGSPPKSQEDIIKDLTERVEVLERWIRRIDRRVRMP